MNDRSLEYHSRLTVDSLIGIPFLTKEYCKLRCRRNSLQHLNSSLLLTKSVCDRFCKILQKHLSSSNLPSFFLTAA